MTQETAPPGGAGSDQDNLAEIIARVQAASESGEPQARVRMQLVQEGVDAVTADAIVDRVYEPAPSRLSQRHRSREGSSSGGGGMSWLIWIGLLAFINLLSWLLDWPFWIY